MKKHLERLNKIRSLTHDWDSYGTGPIREEAISLAESFLEGLNSHGLLPDRILPGGEGYVHFWWSKLGLDTDFFYDGEILIGVKHKLPDGDSRYEVIEATPETYVSKMVELAHASKVEAG